MNKPIAVLITDIHFTLATLDKAAAAFLKAQFKAKILGVSLVVLGDTLDAKRIIAAECANKLIELLSVKDAPDTIFLVGNHDKINEKSEEHALNFLKPYATVVDKPAEGFLSEIEVMLIPYQHDNSIIKNILKDEDYAAPKLLLMHQGIMGSEAGHYIQDKSACPKEWFKNHRVVSGHYHKTQDIVCAMPGDNGVGIFTYLGNPYTLNFGEANDPEKGYHVLYEDGSLELIPLKLSRHVIVELESWTVSNPNRIGTVKAKPNDILWIKINGPKEELSKLTKSQVAKACSLTQDFKLDLIPLETKTDIDIKSSTQDKATLLDGLIDSLTNVDDNHKKRLKSMWKEFSE